MAGMEIVNASDHALYPRRKLDVIHEALKCSPISRTALLRLQNSRDQSRWHSASVANSRAIDACDLADALRESDVSCRQHVDGHRWSTFASSDRWTVPEPCRGTQRDPANSPSTVRTRTRQAVVLTRVPTVP